PGFAMHRPVAKRIMGRLGSLGMRGLTGHGRVGTVLPPWPVGRAESMKRGRHRRRSLLGVQAVVLSIAVVVPLALPQHVHDLPPPIGVTIKSEVRYLPLHSTFGQAQPSLGLQARSGNFLDVTGRT